MKVSDKKLNLYAVRIKVDEVMKMPIVAAATEGEAVETLRQNMRLREEKAIDVLMITNLSSVVEMANKPIVLTY